MESKANKDVKAVKVMAQIRRANGTIENVGVISSYNRKSLN